MPSADPPSSAPTTANLPSRPAQNKTQPEDPSHTSPPSTPQTLPPADPSSPSNGTTPPSNTTSPTTASTTPPPTGPTAPPTENLQNLLASLNETPLFMTSLPTASNPSLDALRALAYEGTPSEVASNFRQQGNECVAEKRWSDARDFYTQGLDWLAGKGRRTKHEEEGDEGREVDWLDSLPQDSEGGGAGVVDIEAEEAAQVREKELGYTNRARVNIELGNYGQACRDCAAALSINPRNLKALYRSALALYSLDKLAAAANAVTQVLSVDAANVAARKLGVRIESRRVKLEAEEKERRGREERRVKEARTLHAAVKRRGWVARGSPAADMQDAVLALEDALDEKSELSVPVLLVYPTASQTELVKKVGERDTVGMHLAEALPVPWDTSGVEFGGSDGDKVECFVERPDGGLSKLGKKVKIGKVLGDAKAVVEAGMVKVFVVPKNKMEEWIAEEKRRRAR